MFWLPPVHLAIDFIQPDQKPHKVLVHSVELLQA
jgi:hypothetical protein